ncbi:MAG: aquaporin [Actinomycetota bacterium]|nr:aquaporin [Actinomycetota bacterium]
METQNNGRILVAELVGTMVLMLGGPGVAIFTASEVGVLGVALGFGFSLLIMAYVIGPISGCHINPAVTLGMLLTRKINGAHAVFAVIGQLLGGVAGAAIIYGIASGRDDFQRGQFAANLWSGPYFGVGAAIVAEVVLTALLVMVVLFTTSRKFAPGMGGLVIGLTLTLIHLISIPIDNTSVNPARSIGAALFADPTLDSAFGGKWAALRQLWVFVVFPLVGAVVGVVVWLVLDDTRLEDTMLAEVPGLTEVRDTLDRVADEAVDAVEDITTND